MPGKTEPQAIPPYLLERECVGPCGHSINRRGDAGQLGVSDPFHFNNTETASSVGLRLSQWAQARVVTEGRDIDSGPVGCLKYSHALIDLDLLVVNSKSYLSHFSPRIDRVDAYI